MTKELPQMHNMNVFRPVMQELLSVEKKKKALALLMFLKERQDMSVKAQMCANQQGQRSNWEKKDTISPTVLTESVFIMVVIHAHKGCNVVCFDIPGAFLHSDTDKDITTIFKRTLAELMV